MPRRRVNFSGRNHYFPVFRFPNLFPPLKPETVARRTVEAVQQNQALLLLPWTMNILIILKRYRIGERYLFVRFRSNFFLNFCGLWLAKRQQAGESECEID